MFYNQSNCIEMVWRTSNYYLLWLLIIWALTSYIKLTKKTQNYVVIKYVFKKSLHLKKQFEYTLFCPIPRVRAASRIVQETGNY